jgi:hypothetical protein
MNRDISKRMRTRTRLKKRAFERIPASLEFHSFDVDYFGVVTDLSENGMFIKSQKISFPFHSQFEISLPLNEDLLNIPVKVTRVTKSKRFYDGIGVELLRPSRNYLRLVRKLRSAYNLKKVPN